MSDNLTIDQRKFGHSRTFAFGEESLVYTLRDPSGERTFTIPYQVIQSWEISGVRSTNPRFFQKLSGACFVGFLAAWITSTFSTAAGSVIGLVSIIAFIGLWISHVVGAFAISFTHIPMQPMPQGANHRLMSIIGDRDRDRIVDELTRRSYARIRALYGKANLAADPTLETQRLGFLRDRAIISPEEYEAEIHRLRMVQLMPSTSGASGLN